MKQDKTNPTGAYAVYGKTEAVLSGMFFAQSVGSSAGQSAGGENTDMRPVRLSCLWACDAWYSIPGLQDNCIGQLIV